MGREEKGKRRDGRRWKRIELQPPGNSALSEPPQTDHRYLPEIHSLPLTLSLHSLLYTCTYLRLMPKEVVSDTFVLPSSPAESVPEHSPNNSHT